MRLSDTTICVLCVILAIALLITAGMRLDSINSKRKEMKLIVNEPLENAPPTLAFATVAMGAFRGLVVDILWIRAEKLKEEGQFFDAKQLAEWITVLQPRFAAVWEFQSWNMAYNISAAIPSSQPQQRWQWVKNGYELIRDQGIVLNPKSIILYRQLAFIFQHKIGAVTDEAHKYYKLQLLKAMEPLLGSADNKYFDTLIKTPKEWQKIIEDEKVASFISALRAADETFLNCEGGKFVSNYLSLRQNHDRFNPKAFEIINNFRGTDGLDKFDIFAKSYQLRNVWKLEPKLMNELNHLYGPINWDDPNTHLPLDWRHPDTHAIYWAVKGLKEASRKDFSIDEVNTDRIVAHSLQNLFRVGKIFVYDVPIESKDETESFASPESYKLKKELFLRSDLRMFEPYNKTVLKIIEKYKTLKRSSYDSLRNGHKNMLKNALFSFYQAGHKRQALRLYNQLRTLYPLDEEVHGTLDSYVKKRLAQELYSLDVYNAKEMIEMMLRESYFRYAVHDDDHAFNLENWAKEIYEKYQLSSSDEHRVKLPDFKMMRYFALLDFFNDAQYPQNLRVNLLGRIKIERPELAEQLKTQELKQLELMKESQKKQ